MFVCLVGVGIFIFIAIHEPLELTTLHHSTQIFNIFNWCSTNGTSIITVRYPIYDTISMIQMCLITLKLGYLVSLFEILITYTAFSLGRHCRRIELSPLQFINYLSNLTIAIKLSRWPHRHRVTESAVYYWSTYTKQAKYK